MQPAISFSLSAFLLLFACLHRTHALDNGLSQKPPLGFNTWNYFGCYINEGVVRSAAARLVSLGLVEAGYNYLNLDDCWQSHDRSSDGQLQADPAKFPSGMAALAADVHKAGLRFGIYSDAGAYTCAGYPGSRHHEEVDAKTFAAWGVDYLKYDNCFAEDIDLKERYSNMRDALNKTGRPIYYSMCNWGCVEPWEWAHEVGNSWRTYEDIFPNWPSLLRSLDYGAAGLAQYARPGGWNDPDMLEVGVAKFTLAQQRSHFALWSLVKAPLLIGANLEAIGEDSLRILKAKELIEINQDDLGVAGDIIWKDGSSEIWAAPLVNNQRAVVLFNRHKTWFPQTIRVTWSQLGYTSESSGPGFKARVRDLYAELDLGVFEGGFEAQISSHDVIAIKVIPVSQVPAQASKWRPWSDPAAAALHARMRAASQRARQWAKFWGQVKMFILAHRYSLAFAAAVLVGAVAVATVRLLQRLRRRGGLLQRYQPCAASEMSFREKGGKGSAEESPPAGVLWEALPSRSPSPELSDSSSSSSSSDEV